MLDNIEKFIEQSRIDGIELSLINENVKVIAPVGKSITHVVEFVKTNKERIVDFLKSPPQKKKDKSSFLVTPLQKKIWFECISNEISNKAHNMHKFIVIENTINLNKLNRIFNDLISKYCSLRSTFNLHKGNEVRQDISDSSQCGYEIVKSKIYKSDYQSKLNQLINLNFNLDIWPLFNIEVLELDNNTILCFSIHHIICDGISLEIILRELLNGYKYDIHLGLTHYDYDQYAEDLHTKLKSSSFAQEAEGFWRKEINKISPDNILTKKNILNYQKSKGRIFSKKIERHQKNKKYCKNLGVTQYSYYLTMLGILLSKYYDLDDVTFGTPISGRDNPNHLDVVGLLLNTVPITVELEKDLIGTLRKSSKKVFKILKYQDYPLEQIILEKNIKKLYSFFFQFRYLDISHENESESIFDEEFGDINNMEINLKNDISFIFTEQRDSLDIAIHYDSSIFEEIEIKNIYKYFENLLIQTVDEQTHNIDIENLNILSVEEEQKLLNDFNLTIVDYPRTKTLVDLFESRVDKNPDCIAVQDSRLSFTYRMLNEKSDIVASYLLLNFGNSNEPIGVLMNRSSELIALLLGILKSGKSYVPIDPALPAERISYIINHSKISVIISDEDSDGRLKTSGISGIVLKDEVFRLRPIEESILKYKPCSEDTAYIIYTSGSTGNPKGVEIRHQSLTNFLRSIQNRPGIKIGDILYSVTTFSFDISILEFFAPLISGASVFIANKETLGNVELLKKELEYINPSVIQATPSFYQMLFNVGWKGNENLRMFCGGDSLNEALAEKLIMHSKEVWNMYGPTETTIWSSIKKIEKASDASNIGKPINNTQIYIVDKNLNLLPPNKIGRIFIAGDGLAKGYYKNETLTQDKFIDNPFSTTDKNNLKMYETGDLGKWNEEGEIEFLGRNDFQVKIRGFRIELGEIETKLQEYPNIKQAVADAKEVKGEKVLVAYYTKDNESNIDKTELREYLQSKLPEYMVPGFFVEMETIPLTPNGKIDRKSLPSVTGEDLIRREYVAPRNETEQKLVEIWREVLKIDRIGITDNFFELGGHSLQLFAVFSKVSAITDLDINTNLIFSRFTINEIVNLGGSISIIKEADSSQNIFLFPPIFGSHLIFKPIYDSVDYNFYGFNYNETVFESIIDIANVFIDQFKKLELKEDEKITFIGYSMGGNIAFEILKKIESEFKNIKFLLIDSQIQPIRIPESKDLDIIFEESILPIEYEKTIRKNLKVLDEYIATGKLVSKTVEFKCQNKSSTNTHFFSAMIAKVSLLGDHWTVLEYDSNVSKIIKNI